MRLSGLNRRRSIDGIFTIFHLLCSVIYCRSLYIMIIRKQSNQPCIALFLANNIINNIFPVCLACLEG